MSIDKTYNELLIEDFLKKKIEAGEFSTIIKLRHELLSYFESLDLSIPQFNAENHKVQYQEESSANKLNNTFKTIHTDLRVLYKEMQNLGDTATITYERYRLEAEALERRLENLENRIENLLLLAQDTDGYHSFFIDNFSDNYWVDQDNTTANVDSATQIVSIKPANSTPTRIYLEDLISTDVSFKIRSTIDFINRTDATNSELTYPFKQAHQAWSTTLNTKSSRPMTCELWIKLANEPIDLNSIYIELNDSCRSSLLNITPLYSIDNYTFTQLPTVGYTQDIRSSCLFSFDKIKAKYIKFLLTKNGPDPGLSTDDKSYQFGFKEISFYNEGFTRNSSQVMVSRPIYIKDSLTNEPVEFSKIVLEACERVEAGTSINYFVAVSNDVEFPTTNITWHPISPVSHAMPNYPTILDLGDISDYEVSPSIAYDLMAENDFINPSASFHLLSYDVGLIDDIVDSTTTRYMFTNSDERILNYQLKDSSYSGSGIGGKLNIDENSIIIFRNVGERGLQAEEETSQVRSVHRGWGFKDPYYTCIIEIKNPIGISIDFGDQGIIIDEKFYTGVVDATVLSGKESDSKGLHLIKIHKDNWLAVPSNLNSLDALKTEDLLYPYNHKLLIEGYSYGPSYQSNEEQIYKGVDLFAEFLMKKISIFDLIGSVAAGSFKYFALDKDANNTHVNGNKPTQVFVIKVDEDNPDFQNEKFVLRFKQVNQKFKYLRFKAELSTQKNSITPILDSYKIKFA